jgi:hypothetical protein
MYLSDLSAVAFGVWITSGPEKLRISFSVIPPTVGDPVKFQWSVANSRTIRSSMRLLLIGYVIRIRCV